MYNEPSQMNIFKYFCNLDPFVEYLLELELSSSLFPIQTVLSQIKWRHVIQGYRFSSGSNSKYDKNVCEYYPTL